MLGELRGQVVTLAMAAAQRVIQDSMDEKRQHALLDEFFSGVKNGKVVVLEGKSLTGQAAEVVSALPLNEKEQATVLQEMKSMLGGTPAAEAIFYCGSGVSVAHDLIAVEHAGLGLPRVYIGSWSDWIADPARPIATGETP